MEFQRFLCGVTGVGLLLTVFTTTPAVETASHAVSVDWLTPVTFVPTPRDGGIHEDIPKSYRSRYDRWKAELLSTEFGRTRWQRFAEDKEFRLNIRVSSERGMGAGTDKFEWNESGALVGATITLGPQIDDGYPTPVYYPVLNSLSPETLYAQNGRVLAATKLAHELGHVMQTAKADVKVLQLQNRLIPQYVSIFLKNGFNVHDKRLVDMADQMGGTPVEIWESREYWSEVDALLYLKERMGDQDGYCRVLGKIKRNLANYAGEYESRFEQFPDITSSPCWRSS
jgi:hypothetical protein